MTDRRDFLIKGFAALSIAAAPEGFLEWFKASSPEGEPILYGVQGQTVFPVYGPSGALTMQVRSWLVQVKGNVIYTFGFDPRVANAEAAARLSIKHAGIVQAPPP